MDDDVEMMFRLEDEVARGLAQLAADAGITMNDLVNDILEITADQWELKRRGSRNGREGRYVGHTGHERDWSPTDTGHRRSHAPVATVSSADARLTTIARALRKSKAGP